MRGVGSHAFTLIELIAVIVITAILAGVALPAMGSIADARQGGSLRVVAQDLAFAREQAINAGARTWVAFDVASDSYSILQEPESGTGYTDAVAMTDPATGQSMGRTFGLGEFPGVSIVAASFDGQAVCGFDWVGAPIAPSLSELAAAGTVDLNGGGRVSVFSGSGLIRVQ